MKGFDTMNNNKVFETDKIFTQHLDHPALKPKNATSKCRVAKVDAGVVILPDNGSPITAKEVVKALGLKDVEPEAEKERRTKIIIDSEYHAEKFYISLTDSQIDLLVWLNDNDLLNDFTWDTVENVDFKEI